MLHSISWQEFFTAIALIVGGYYVINVLLLYSTEIKAFFKRNKSKSIEQSVQEDQTDSNETNDLMGKVKYVTTVNVPHENSHDVEDILFRSSEEVEEVKEQESASLGESATVSSIAELLKQIKSMIKEVAPANKQEASAVIAPILLKYPRLVGTDHQDAISIFILSSLPENARGQIDLGEIKSWWCDRETSVEEN